MALSRGNHWVLEWHGEMLDNKQPGRTGTQHFVPWACPIVEKSVDRRAPAGCERVAEGLAHVTHPTFGSLSHTPGTEADLKGRKGFVILLECSP